MSFVRGGETITIRRRTATGTDDYGNPVYTTADTIVKEVLVGIGTTTEPVDPERDAVDAGLELYMEGTVLIKDGDIFIIRGTEWIKDGSAKSWVSPFVGLFTGTVIAVRRRRG